MKKTISILGSTGSIGLTTLSIIKKKKNLFIPYLFTGNKNFPLICKQIKEFKPKYFIIFDTQTYLKIKKKFKNNKVKILNNFENFKLKKKSEITITAIPGLDGLFPTILMTKFSNKVLIANKESIVCGWNLIFNIAKKHNTKLISIDSELFSINELLKSTNINKIKKIYITASGGPFLNYKLKKFEKITPSQAIKHPRWKMGKKISIESATLMNKMFEVIEAKKLYKIPSDKIEILIHPESLIHALVELKNGLTKLVYHETSMIIPIVNSIFQKDVAIDHFMGNAKNFISESKVKNLIFKLVDKNKFPIINIKKRLDEFPSTPIIINASNEILVDQFLKRKIPYLAISKTIISILNHRNYKEYAIKKPSHLNIIYKIDKWARNLTIKNLKKYK